MDIKKLSVPEIYQESQDFRFFIDLFSKCLTKIDYDTENVIDLYDPLRCPEQLLWMLADTMGYKLHDSLPIAFNRLVLLYFMSMINYRGSVTGMTLAAETNLAQFRIIMDSNGYTDESGAAHDGQPILANRLDDTSIPVNSVFVTPDTENGCIDVVYFSTKIPKDACIEYVRPLGMYLNHHAGVRFDAKTKLTIDGRLTNLSDTNLAFGPTFVGHYRRDDYARLQKELSPGVVDTADTRHPVWDRNSKYEVETDPSINPGYRALSSLQLANGEHVMKALIDPIFSLGYEPQDIDVVFPDNYLQTDTDPRKYNLRYDRDLEEAITPKTDGSEYDISTIDPDETESIINPRPKVNDIMSKLGDAIDRVPR